MCVDKKNLSNEADKSLQNLEESLQKMMTVTKSFDNFRQMMKTTRSFDEEVEAQKKASEKALVDAFQRMIDLSYELERESEKEFSHPPKDVNIEKFPAAGDKFFHQLVSKLPPKIRRFPYAFRRNPKAVIKYFAAMIFGRILAILMYVLAAFIPALPIPESVAGWMGKPPTFVGSALVNMRGFVADFSPQMMVATVSSIPTDINKLLQKVGEFFQYYAKRTSAFFIRAARNPRRAFDDICEFFRTRTPLLARLSKSAVGVAFSFLLIKLAMIFLLPLFGGIALTVLGIKVSIILFVIARMIADKIGEFIGKHIFKRLVTVYKMIKAVRNMLAAWKN